MAFARGIQKDMRSFGFAQDDGVGGFPIALAEFGSWLEGAVSPRMPGYAGDYFVYFMASNNRRALYVGVTNELERRVQEHRAGLVRGFTSDYHCVHLVFFEGYREAGDAIAREKQLKGWRRAKKDALVARENSEWLDLASGWS